MKTYNDARFVLTYLDSQGNEQRTGGSLTSLTEVSLLQAQFPTCTSLIVERINHDEPIYTYHKPAEPVSDRHSERSERHSERSERQHDIDMLVLTISNDYKAYTSRFSTSQYTSRCVELKNKYHTYAKLEVTDVLQAMTEALTYWSAD